MDKLEGIIFLAGKCNQNCLFCSAGGVDKTRPEASIKRAIGTGKRTVSIEGGEPTLSKDLVKWVKYARARGAEDVIVCSNGIRFNDAAYVRSLTDAGVTLFNINLPSHIERLFDLLTQTRGQYQKRLDGLRTLIEAAGRVLSMPPAEQNRQFWLHLPARNIMPSSLSMASCSGYERLLREGRAALPVRFSFSTLS